MIRFTHLAIAGWDFCVFCDMFIITSVTNTVGVAAFGDPRKPNVVQCFCFASSSSPKRPVLRQGVVPLLYNVCGYLDFATIWFQVLCFCFAGRRGRRRPTYL